MLDDPKGPLREAELTQLKEREKKSWLIRSLCIFSHEATGKHFIVLAEKSQFQIQVGCSRKKTETCGD